MTRKLTRGATALALGLLGGALAGGGRPAEAATLIQSCGFTAMLPGTYVLARDLTCPGTAITVAANNVNLVLAGHTLTAIATFGRDGLFAQSVTGLTITGGTIVGFNNFGLDLSNTPDARVTGVTVTGSLAGILVVDTTGARLTGNTVTNNRLNGIGLGSSTGALL